MIGQKLTILGEEYECIRLEHELAVRYACVPCDSLRRIYRQRPGDEYVKLLFKTPPEIEEYLLGQLITQEVEVAEFHMKRTRPDGSTGVLRYFTTFRVKKGNHYDEFRRRDESNRQAESAQTPGGGGGD